MKIDFQINKPSEVDEENMTAVVDSIYDTINRLASATNKFVSKTLPSNEPSGVNDKLKIVDDHNTGEVKISVKVGGQWYTTTSLTRED